MAELGKNRHGKKYIIAATLMIAVCFLFLPAMTLADQVELSETGQTSCYDTNGTEVNCSNTGQDGDVQAGVDWPDPRFTDNGDGTITDNLTGLMWTRDGQVAGDSNFKTWEEALDYVADMNQGSRSNFGYTDWRLPNILDLLSLSNLGVSSMTDWLIDQGFTNVYPSNSRNFYWSSTTLASKPEMAWIFNVLSVSTWTFGKTTGLSVWPVRGGQQDDADPDIPASIRKTGQTSCNDASGEVIDCTGTGQDGDTQAGVAWPEPRFVDNGDGTVTDRLTNLIWIQDPNEGGQKTWQESLDYIGDEENFPALRRETDGMKGDKNARQAASDYIAGLNGEGNAGGAGWHLANTNELMSLIDFSGTSSMLPPGSPFSSPGVCWSSNTLSIPRMEDAAWVIGFYPFDFGVMFESTKDSTNTPWAVSDGEDLNTTSGDAVNVCTGGDPVLGTTGEHFFDTMAIILAGPLPITFELHYGSDLSAQVPVDSALGPNWCHNFDLKAIIDTESCLIVFHRGKTISFSKNGTVWEMDGQEEEIYQFNESGDDYVLMDPGESLVYTFSSAGRLVSVKDRNGNTLSLTYGGDLLASVTDGLGRGLTFAYDANNQLINVEDLWGRSITFGHDSDGLLTTSNDLRGNTTTYSYTAKGSRQALMTTRLFPRGNIHWTNYYDDQGRVERQVNALGDVFTFAYPGSTGGSTAITSPLGSASQYEHVKDLYATKRVDPAGKVTDLAYDDNGHRTGVTDRRGNSQNMTFQPDSGKMESFVDADGNTWGFTYASTLQDGFRYYDLTGVSYSDGTSASYTYDGKGNILTFTDSGGNVWNYTYNSMGQTTSVEDPTGARVTFTYNPDGTLASHTNCTGNTFSYAHDSYKRLREVTGPDSTTVSYTYDNASNILSVMNEEGNTTSYTYDANGNMVTVVDPLGQTTANNYDNLDRLAGVTDALANTRTISYNGMNQVTQVTDPDGGASVFQYNELGFLTSLTDSKGKVWAFDYDSEGNLTGHTNPLGKTWHFTPDSYGRTSTESDPLFNSVSYIYDEIGRLKQTVGALGNSTTYTYNALDALVGITESQNQNVSYEVNEDGGVTRLTDPNGNNWYFSYDCFGQLTGKTNPLNQTVEYAYDSQNRLSRVTYPQIGTGDFIYDRTGLLLNMNFSDGTTLTYAYDDAGLMTSATGMTLAHDANGAITSSNGIGVSYDNQRRVASITLDDGKSVTYSYDNEGLVTAVNDWNGGQTRFDYDDAGRLTAITRPNGVTTTRSYDDANRLSTIYESKEETDLSAITLTRDAAGQTTRALRDQPLEPVFASGTTTYTYNGAHQNTGFSYDALGRRVSDGSRSYTWDLVGRLTSYDEGGGTVSFTYDAFGNRLIRVVAGITQEYIWNYALEIPSISMVKQDGQVTRYHVHTPAGELLYVIEASSDNRHYYHYDEMGNTLFLTDDTGSITDSYGYTPYGVWADSSGGFDNPFTFGGALGVMREGGTGLYYMRARYYDSRTARFISVDPLWPDFLEIKSLNPYEYGAQNPLRYSDPTGNKEYDLVFIESEKGRLDEELSHFSLHYQKQNPQWSDTVAGIKRYIDKLLKDDTCDCVKSLNLVSHGSNLGEGPFNLALENLRSMEKNIRRRVIPKAVRKGILSGERTTLWNRLSKRRAERAVAKQYYKKRGGKLGELVVLLMDIKWCPQNEGVTFTSCNLLGNWGWSNDKTVAKLQLLANRTGLKLTGYTTKARVSRGRFVLGVTKTVTPDVTR